MRLFFAFGLPTHECDRLASLLPDPAPGIRRVPSGRMHVTLRFVGDVSEDTRRALAGDLVRLRIRAGSACLRGAGTFPGRGRPRVLWAGIAAEAAVMRAREAVEALCRKAGIDHDPLPWSPHVTLGRMKGRRPEWLDRFLADNESLASPPFPVERIVLYDSVPDPSGVRYEEVAVCRARPT